MTYKCPQEDTQFILENVLDFYGHYERLGFEDLNKELLDTIFEEFARLTENEIAPLNAVVTKAVSGTMAMSPRKGFKQAYDQYVEGGWPGMAQSTDFGGRGFPYSSFTMISEWVSSSNHAWRLARGLARVMETIHLWHRGTKAAVFTLIGFRAVDRHHVFNGSTLWFGLRFIEDPAVPQEDGSYSLTGTKIFITAGEHDMSDNIMHIVLARLPDAPADTKGISLFIVPKFNVSESGKSWIATLLSCGSIEHKMGIHGSATCVMNFDGAKGYLLGPANKGLNCMFTFMNSARIGTGVEGLGASQFAYQNLWNTRTYSERSGRSRTAHRRQHDLYCSPGCQTHVTDSKSHGRRQPCFCHVLSVSGQYVIRQRSRCEKTGSCQTDTPIPKPLPPKPLRKPYYGMQIFGGHGYVKEWGMEQLARDTRISSLYGDDGHSGHRSYSAQSGGRRRSGA